MNKMVKKLIVPYLIVGILATIIQTFWMKIDGSGELVYGLIGM